MDSKEFNALLNKFNDLRKAWADVYGKILKYRVTKESSKIDMLKKIKEEGRNFLNVNEGIFKKIVTEIAATQLGIEILNGKKDTDSRNELNRLKLQLSLLKRMQEDKNKYFTQLASYLK